ncbi:F-box/kelch-repeat protein At3g27150 isoform X1 [Nymphaea colorata]|nr:F-box/kelch-repeat protein At3g27150 isoform X1 [Nymphaea colorata]XP_049931762.1 F-box/kelch-repeat protein At3g27150 isoform X1 [Nymphaea colorata]XP_049931763.1 F-box/kelch-repeat protein At3g27150 isoform X1 [Nymphaea colorata]
MCSGIDLPGRRYNLRSNGVSSDADSERGSEALVHSFSSRTRRRRVITNNVGSDEPLGLRPVNPNMEEDTIDSNGEPQDADYSYIPLLSDELALLILARIPRSEHPKLCCINKRYMALVKNGELSKIRREIGVTEPLVIIFASGEHHWWEHSPSSGLWRKLPDLPSEPSFHLADRESLCVDTQLLISGLESNGMSVWRYELLTNSWHKGPSMATPRCLFASANCGDVARVAGGTKNRTILNSAEQYNPRTKSWEPMPSMKQRRKLCSGCFMDNKFYVVGGVNEEGKLTSGEFFDREKKTWHLIPGMINDLSSSDCQSPPLVAVVNNELYSLETTTNKLKVYLKQSNSWKDLGMVPVRANHSRGWGVAFKSLGDRLLVIGAAWNAVDHHSQGISIFSCQPDPNARDAHWFFLGRTGNFMGPFVFNCSIMAV